MEGKVWSWVWRGHWTVKAWVGLWWRSDGRRRDAVAVENDIVVCDLSGCVCVPVVSVGRAGRYGVVTIISHGRDVFPAKNFKKNPVF